MEENFSMEWKIYSMEWKWNERKLPVWNMEKLSSIPFPSYHALHLGRVLRPGKSELIKVETPQRSQLLH